MLLNAFDRLAANAGLVHCLKAVCVMGLALAVSGSLAIGTAVAEEHDDEASVTAANELEEVVVQALRRDGLLQKTPVAVSVLSQDALDQGDIVDVIDLNNAFPSLIVQTPGDQANPRFILRGVGTTNGTEAGDQTVGFYVDGIFAARAQGALALFYDLEGIQLLRGPQGTLFGRNNTAGALLLQTKRPGDELEGNVELTFGSFERRRISAAVGVPLTDNWGIRLAGVLDVDDGWVQALGTDPRVPQFPNRLNADGTSDNPWSLGAVNRYPDTDRNLNSRDSRSARISSLAKLGPRTEWFFSVEHFINKSADSVLLNPVLVEQGKYEAYIDSPHSLDLKSTAIRSILSVDISDSVQFEWLTGGGDLYRAQVYDLDSGLMNRYQEHRTEFHRSRSGSTEFKFDGSHFDGALDWTAGIYYFEEDTGIRFDIDAIGTWPEGGATFIQPERGAVASAAFTQITYRPIDSFGITVGYRQTEESKYDRGGRSFGNCSGVLRPAPAAAAALGGGNAITTTEDFFNNETGARTKSLNDVAVTGTTLDRIDDRTGRPVFTDKVTNANPTLVDDNGNPIPDGLDDLSGESRPPLECEATQQNELERDFSEGTWLARVEYDLVGSNSETLIYVSAATGYQSGVIQDAGNSTNPEKSLTYELGTKTDFGSFRLNNSLFFNSYTDLIRSLIDPIQNNTIVTNASEAQIFGLEIEATALFGNGGKIDLGLAFLDANYTGQYLFAFNPNDDLPQGGSPSLPIRRITDAKDNERSYYDLDGVGLPYAPTLQLNLGFAWAVQLDRGTLTPRLRAVYTSEHVFNDNNTEISAVNIWLNGSDSGLVNGQRQYHTGNPEGQDAYFKADIGVEWASQHGWVLDFFMNNVTDELVKTSTDCSAGTTAGCAARYLPPTEWGMRIKWNFD